MNRVKNLLAYYKHANVNRRNLTSLKWRVLVVLLLIVVMVVVREHLTGKYLAEFSANPLAYLVLDKVYYWFVAGVIIGIGFSWLLYEGEFVIALYKLVARIESQAFKGLIAAKAAGKLAGKPPARRKKKRNPTSIPRG